MPPSGGRACSEQPGGGGAAVCAAETWLVVVLPASVWMVMLAPRHTMSMRRTVHVVGLRFDVRTMGDVGRGGRRRWGHWWTVLGIVAPLATQAHIAAAADPALGNTIAGYTHMMLICSRRILHLLSLLNTMANPHGFLAAIMTVRYEK